MVAFAKKESLTVDELCLTIGHLAGTFAIAAVRANPEHYIDASEEYRTLCAAAMELGVAMMLDREEAKPKANRKVQVLNEQWKLTQAAEGRRGI